MRAVLIAAAASLVLLGACQPQDDESTVPASTGPRPESVESVEDVDASDLEATIVEAMVVEGVFGPEQVACTEDFLEAEGVPQDSDQFLDLVLACANAGPLAFGEEVIEQFGALDPGVPLVVGTEIERVGQPAGSLTAVQDDLFELTIDAEVAPDADRPGYFLYSELSRSSGPPLFWDGQAEQQFEITQCDADFINYFSTDPREVDLVAVGAIEGSALVDAVNRGGLPIAGTLSLRLLSGEAEASMSDECQFAESYSYQYLAQVPEDLPPGEYWVIVDGWATRSWQGGADVPIDVRIESGTFPSLVIDSP